jgi:glycosyltransferase involved in cell wall biosynthesis
MTLVSVVIPAFNARPWIGECLESVARQEPGELEAIVVDDGSTDGTTAVVEREFPMARIVRTEHAGASRARNVGTRLARGRFIQYVDADDALAPGKLGVQVKALVDSGADVAYGDWQPLLPESSGPGRYGAAVRRRLDVPEIDLFTDFWAPPAAYLFRRSIVERVGGWDEGLPVIQDARFVLDCALRGGTFAYCPGVMAFYRVHPSGSLSRRDPVAFVRDLLRNAEQVEAWWRANGGLGQGRKEALLKVYARVSRASFEDDAGTFGAACRALERLQPGYVPPRPYPRRLRIAARILGYSRAELVAFWYRRARTVARRVLRPSPPPPFPPPGHGRTP